MGDSIALGNKHHIDLKKAVMRVLLYFVVIDVCLVIL